MRRNAAREQSRRKTINFNFFHAATSVATSAFLREFVVNSTLDYHNPHHTCTLPNHINTATGLDSDMDTGDVAHMLNGNNQCNRIRTNATHSVVRQRAEGPCDAWEHHRLWNHGQRATLYLRPTSLRVFVWWSALIWPSPRDAPLATTLEGRTDGVINTGVYTLNNDITLL